MPSPGQHWYYGYIHYVGKLPTSSYVRRLCIHNATQKSQKPERIALVPKAGINGSCDVCLIVETRLCFMKS